MIRNQEENKKLIQNAGKEAVAIAKIWRNKVKRRRVFKIFRFSLRRYNIRHSSTRR